MPKARTRKLEDFVRRSMERECFTEADDIPLQIATDLVKARSLRQHHFSNPVIWGKTA
jgi:hypothetical protein